LRTRLGSATHETVIGLLAATGMRVGEALQLDRGDVAETDAASTIRESKFGKSRMPPLQPSAALQRWARLRDEVTTNLRPVSFFVSTRGNRMVYPTIDAVFRKPLRQRRNRS
jgi:integrase/recombinase XerD